MCVLKTGFLFIASEFGNQWVVLVIWWLSLMFFVTLHTTVCIHVSELFSMTMLTLTKFNATINILLIFSKIMVLIIHIWSNTKDRLFGTALLQSNLCLLLWLFLCYVFFGYVLCMSGFALDLVFFILSDWLRKRSQMIYFSQVGCWTLTRLFLGLDEKYPWVFALAKCHCCFIWYTQITIMVVYDTVRSWMDDVCH